MVQELLGRVCLGADHHARSRGPVHTTPRITIGMPVYNGAATIEASISSLLAQTYGDFELIVSDNASTDATGEVVRGASAGDTRIRYVRQAENIGANRNYNYVARAARGEYLKWASASDWCAPSFLERCLTVLDGDPAAVLAVPRTCVFEGTIVTASGYNGDLQLLDDAPSSRLEGLLGGMKLNNAMNGLIRLDALLQTGLLKPYRGADIVMMGHLALIGRFLLVDEPLFYRRMEPETATAMKDEDAVRRHHYPRPTASSLFQTWKRHAGWVRAAMGAPMGISERIKVINRIGQHLYWDRAALATDLGEALRYATRGPL